MKGWAPGGPFLESPETFRAYSGDIILFVSSKRRRLEARNFAVIFIFIPFTTYEKKTALQNKEVGVLGMAFRAREVLGTFEKRAPDVVLSVLEHSQKLEFQMWLRLRLFIPCDQFLISICSLNVPTPLTYFLNSWRLASQWTGRFFEKVWHQVDPCTIAVNQHGFPHVLIKSKVSSPGGSTKRVEQQNENAKIVQFLSLCPQIARHFGISAKFLCKMLN